MKKTKIFLLQVITLSFCTLAAPTQPSKESTDAVKKYEEIISSKAEEIVDPNTLETISTEKDELALLLPDLNSNLYKDWIQDAEKILNNEEINNLNTPDKDLIKELKAEKVLNQIYRNKNHTINLLIIKFKDVAGTYSAWTVLQNGKPTKLKIGKASTETENNLTFWKDTYFIDFLSEIPGDKTAKEFSILAAQEISKKIKEDPMPPVLAIQLPALNRIEGSERYCLGAFCCKRFFNIEDFLVENFNLTESEGLITAKYKVSENPKDNESLFLVLSRYINTDAGKAVFKTLSEYYKKKAETNKEIKIDISENTVKIKNNKTNYTEFKQKGNLLAIVYNAPDKKSGEKFLELVPWPIEITKP